MRFRLVPKSVTLNDLERRNGRYIELFISGPAVYCIFSTVNTVIGLSCDKERRPVSEFMHEAIVFRIRRV